VIPVITADFNHLTIQQRSHSLRQRVWRRKLGSTDQNWDNMLSRRLDRISEQHRRSRDFTLESLRDALREVIACFPVYRTYIRSDTQHPDEQDERYIRNAIKTAKRRNPATSGSVFDFIQDLLLLNHPDSISDADRAERRLFVMRFQQLTGPVMAKGLEDTAFYRYCPLLSLNEVGGSPDRFGVALTHFHAKNLARRQSWRNAMLAGSTHDTKRSEDVRARINVLSEIPAEWYRAIRTWQRLNEEALDIFFAGDYAGDYEAALVSEFNACLPDKPAW